MSDIHHEPWLDQVRTQAADRLARVAQVQDELSTVSAEARAAEGRVQVRVNAAGRLAALTVAPGALSMAAPDLAAAILRASDEAATSAGARLAELVGSLVPSAELDAMLTGQPTQADRVAVRTELDALRSTDGPAP